MAWKRFNNKKTDTSLPVGLATWPRINSLVNKRITQQQYDFFEAEALEVKSVKLNDIGHRGSVTGIFLNSKIEVIDVKPLKTNITVIPVVGEHVVGVQYQGQYYYTDIINRAGKVNENSMPGASGVYDKDTKFGKTFQSKKVKPTQVGEGSILFEGRFGQTIHLDGVNNIPKVKISTHIDESDGVFRQENIDSDDASIYLLSDGMNNLFNGERVIGKKVLIKSNGIFINGRDEVRINAPQVKLGSKDASEPVVKGLELKKILDMLLDSAVASKESEAGQKAAIQDFVGAAQSAQEAMELRAKKNLPVTPYLSETVKTV